MNLGDAVSSLTGGFWIGFASTSSPIGIMLPGPQTVLTLHELVVTQADDSSRIETWTPVQQLSSILQRIGGKENVRYGRELSDQIWKAYIAYNEFTGLNYQDMIEKNKITATVLGVAYTFDIISAEIKDSGTQGKHYEVLLEVK